VDLKLLYAIFRQADSMQSLTLTLNLTLAYNNLRSTFPVMPVVLVPGLPDVERIELHVGFQTCRRSLYQLFKKETQTTMNI